MLYTIKKEDCQNHRDDCRELTCNKLHLVILAKIEAHLVTIHNRPATKQIRTTQKFYHKHNEFSKETFLTLHRIGLLCVCVCVHVHVCVRVCVCICVCVLVVSYGQCVSEYTPYTQYCVTHAKRHSRIFAAAAIATLRSPTCTSGTSLVSAKVRINCYFSYTYH